MHDQKIEKICKLFELIVLDILAETLENIAGGNEYIVPPPVKNRKDEPF
jgi:hypothetical protein